jgi:acetylornithine deacetylase
MGRVLQALSRYNEDLLKAPPHPLCGHGRFSPGVVRGGVQVNTVPDYCDLEVDRRTLPGETREEVYEEIRSRIEPLVREDPNFQYRLTEPICLVPPNVVPPGHPIVQSLLAAYASVTGKPPQPLCFPAGTDAPNLGFPTVICGPGSIVQAHAVREFVEIDELKKAVEIYLSVVMDNLI